VNHDAVLMTDNSGPYADMHRVDEHHPINHSARIYVEDDVHTQTIEGRFATVKAGFHGVSRARLQSYVNEYAFRYNHRGGVDPFKVLVALSARPVK
jgi:hypothetical protein